jgi:signal transduction histidine kinase/ligand-binding sensor domain-containing protein/DNA-binding response OmpR family regulator
MLRPYLILWLTCLSLQCIAQAGFRFEHITVNEGLAHSDAVSVIQDLDGFIWIATNNGIDRYDGYELKNYKLPNNNNNGLYNNRILALHLGLKGRIWAIADEQGVFFLDQSFKNLSELAEKPEDKVLLQQISARAVIQHPNGDVFIATRNHGLLQVQLKDKITGIKKYPFLNGGASIPLSKLEIDNNGTVWIGTLGLGLWTLSAAQLQRYTPWTHDNVRALYLQKGNHLWIGSDNSVARLQIGQAPVRLEGSFASINCIYEDSFKRIWIGTNFGLHLLQNFKENDSGNLSYSDQVFSVDAENPWAINSNRVHQVFEDTFNNLWFAASSGGLNKISLLAKPFGIINKLNHPAIPDNYINTLWNDDPYLWIGTRNGLSRFNKLTHESKNILNNTVHGSTTHISVSSLYDPGDGKMWISSRENGIFILDKKTFALRRLPELPRQKPWSQVEPLCIREDSEGRIWIATFYAGIYLFTKNGDFIAVLNTQNSELPTDKITALYFDSEEKAMWASTRNSGVCKLRLKGSKLEVEKHYFFTPETSHSLKVNYAWPLLKDKKNRLWIGTLGGGLHLIEKVNDKEQITRYEQWLPESNVETILEGENGHLWIGGRGLYKFDPEKKTYLHFDVADGLQSNSFKIGAAATDHKGTLYFGGINGISYFQPARIQGNPHPPKMQITRVRIVHYNDKHPRANLYGPLQNLTLKHQENDFTIEFVGLNFQNPKKQRYAYQLEGYHDQWIPVLPGQRMAAFASLPAGKYTFKVKADNGDGVWATSPAELKFRVLPPWYETWWAYLAYLALIFGAALTYRNVRTKQRDLKNRIALEQMEKKKEKELAEMKLNFFTNVSHELRTPLSLILHPAEDLMHAVGPETEAHHKAELVHKQANKLLSLVNQLMDLRKVETGNMPLLLEKADIVGFVQEIFLIFKIKAEEQNITYDYTTSHREYLADFDLGKLEIILTNLLSNAFKYTADGGFVHLKLNILSDGQIQLSLQDSGSGIHPQDIKNIFEPFFQSVNRTKVPGTGIGLALVKELVQMMGGEITVESELTRGSTFSVTLPLLSTQETVPLAAAPQLLPDDFHPETLPQVDGNLLIVEDNADLRSYLEKTFSNSLKVSTAENGREGWEKVLLEMPDLVLSDVMMPEMDGLELCSKIKSHPKAAHIPVVLITARAAAVHELEGLESGADDYIVKPFNTRILFSKVHNLLVQRKKLREHFKMQWLLEPKESDLPDQDLKFLEHAMNIIEENLNNKQFGVQSLVQSSGMSQSAYYRKLKNLTGQSVVEFIRDVRLKKAAQLLSTGKFRITEVMDHVGIEDYKYFRSAFQKLYHVTPSEFAKNNVKTNT